MSTVHLNPIHDTVDAEFAGIVQPIVTTVARPRCADGHGTLTHLFFSEVPLDIARAKAICGKCTLADTCRQAAVDRAENELWKKSMDAIGLRTDLRKDRTPELRKMTRLGKIPVRDDGWNADYPDGENFMQLLYSGSVGQENHSRFALPEFDKLYEAARRLPDSKNSDASGNSTPPPPPLSNCGPRLTAVWPTRRKYDRT